MKTWLVLLLWIVVSACAAEAAPRRGAAAVRSRPFIATAYCRSGRTQSGVRTRAGVVAADPRVLPIGSVVRIDSGPSRRKGSYTVLDTGGRVKGRRLDIFVPSCRAARNFGKRRVRVAVVRRGWGPEATVAKR